MTSPEHTPLPQRAERAAPSRFRITAWTVAALLLLIPFVATQLSDEVHWTASDFVFVGSALLVVGGLLELVVRTTRNAVYRWATGAALGTALLLVWVNGAVGIIGAETNDVNLLYGGVLAVGLVGALLARFQPRGMAWAMAATALAQTAIGIGALLAGLGAVHGTAEILALNAGFVTLWSGAAALFRWAALQRKERGAV